MSSISVAVADVATIPFQLTEAPALQQSPKILLVPPIGLDHPPIFRTPNLDGG